MESDSQLDNRGHPTTTLFAPRVSSAAKEDGVRAQDSVCMCVYIYTRKEFIFVEWRKRETRDKVSLPRKERRRKREIRKRREQNKGGEAICK